MSEAERLLLEGAELGVTVLSPKEPGPDIGARPATPSLPCLAGMS